MAALFSRNNRKKILQSFYKKTGIQLTDEPKTGIPEADRSEELFFLVQEEPYKAIPEIKALIDKYPDVPTFKNHLYNAYMLTDQRLKSIKLQEEILEQHPKYVFGVVNKIMNIYDPEELKKHEHLLGSPKDIRSLLGHDTLIHTSEFLMYQGAAGYFEALTGEIEAAKDRLETIIELDGPPEQIEFLAKTIAIGTMQDLAKKQEKQSNEEISVDSYPKIDLPQTEEPPKLNHEELRAFYSTSTDTITEKQISEILSLPEESLIKDLNTILEDSIRRWGYFTELDYEKESHEFIMHALYFSGALDNAQSLNSTLNLLRMGDEFMDYWFSDIMFECFYPTLFSQGKDQLEILKEYVQEEGLSPYCRGIVSETVAQVAIHYPERRSEVLDWFQSVIQYHLDHPNNEELIDTVFLGFIIGDLTGLRATELIPFIEQLHANGWANEIMNGTLEQILKYIHLDYHESERKPLPKDIHEYYSGAYIERKVNSIPQTEEEEKLLDKIQNSKAEKAVMEQFSLLFEEMENMQDDDELDYYDRYDDDDDDYEPAYIEPFKRETPKVGRNEPCPCGSGKKYKKCCINK